MNVIIILLDGQTTVGKMPCGEASVRQRKSLGGNNIPFSNKKVAELLLATEKGIIFIRWRQNHLSLFEMDEKTTLYGRQGGGGG